MRGPRQHLRGTMKSKPTESNIASREQVAKNLAFLVVQALRSESQSNKHNKQETDQDTAKSKAKTGHIT